MVSPPTLWGRSSGAARFPVLAQSKTVGMASPFPLGKRCVLARLSNRLNGPS